MLLQNPGDYLIHERVDGEVGAEVDGALKEKGERISSCGSLKSSKCRFQQRIDK